MSVNVTTFSVITIQGMTGFEIKLLGYSNIAHEKRFYFCLNFDKAFRVKSDNTNFPDIFARSISRLSQCSVPCQIAFFISYKASGLYAESRLQKTPNASSIAVIDGKT